MKFTLITRPAGLLAALLVTHAIAHDYSTHRSSLKRYTHRQGHNGTLKDDQFTKYLLPLTANGQTVYLEIDTGSSDTWILQKNYQCYQGYDNATQSFVKPVNESVCNYGNTVDFGPINGQGSQLHQLTVYGSASAANVRATYGPLRYTNVTINNITVPQQLISAANETSNPNPTLPEYSGLLGLAFPAGTKAYNSSGNNASTQYSSLINTLFETPAFASPKRQKFSLALSRDASSTGDGGVLTIGGIPDLKDPSINVSSTYTSAPLQYYHNASKTNYSFYAMTVDSFKLGNSVLSPNTSVIIDSGYNGLEIPQALFDETNKQWQPQGNLSGTTLFLDCNARLSEPFGVTIGNATYYVDSADLNGRMENGSCYSLFYPGPPPNGYSLGDPFLRNTLAVFDWGQKSMSFYTRQYYKS